MAKTHVTSERILAASAANDFDQEDEGLATGGPGLGDGVDIILIFQLYDFFSPKIKDVQIIIYDIRYASTVCLYFKEMSYIQYLEYMSVIAQHQLTKYILY